MDAQLNEVVVLVTGASGGIGQELVRQFAREGARVVAHYHRQAEPIQALVAEFGSCIHPVQADLTSEEHVERLFQNVEQHWGPISTVIANAGIWPAESVPLHEMTLTQWQQTLDVDLTAVFLTLRRFLQAVATHELPQPSVVLIGSTAGVFGEAGHADYAAAKSAITYGLLASLKNEIARLAPRGRVNAVCPGWVLTPMTETFAEDHDAVRRAQQTIALRKFATPLDIAQMSVVLASAALSGHVTGQRVVVSGGMEGRVLYTPDEIPIEPKT